MLRLLTKQCVFFVLLLAFTCHLQATTPSQTILVMGDSLSASYGIARGEGWVELLQTQLAAEKSNWQIANASISGETTAGGAARIDAAIKQHQPQVVVIELGANDGLRGLPTELAKTNLQRMIEAALATNAKVLLLGMRIPPNYGADYANAFESMFADLSKQHKVALLPFFLEPIALDRNAFQNDNLHPTADAQPKILQHVMTKLSPLITAGNP